MESARPGVNGADGGFVQQGDKGNGIANNGGKVKNKKRKSQRTRRRGVKDARFYFIPLSRSLSLSLSLGERACWRRSHSCRFSYSSYLDLHFEHQTPRKILHGQ